MTPIAFLLGAAAGAVASRLRGNDREDPATAQRAQEAERERDALRAKLTALTTEHDALRASSPRWRPRRLRWRCSPRRIGRPRR